MFDTTALINLNTTFLSLRKRYLMPVKLELIMVPELRESLGTQFDYAILYMYDNFENLYL